jgi:3-oxoacyl-[acyl-carrier-protein] synthase-3
MTVYITQTSHFFPNEPVSNDEMESYLGMVNGKPSLARRIVLSKNGIKSRYYALDKEGHVTHTSVQMAANAIHGLEDEHFSIDDADVLAYGTASPEYVMPSPGVMVHGELGGKNNTLAAPACRPSNMPGCPFSREWPATSSAQLPKGCRRG